VTLHQDEVKRNGARFATGQCRERREVFGGGGVQLTRGDATVGFFKCLSRNAAINFEMTPAQ
jgi:hypothetical protein